MEEIIQSWEINARLNLYVLDSISPDLLSVKLEKGKSVQGQFMHMHNVRLMWIKSAAVDLMEGQVKLDESSTSEEIKARLSESTFAISEIFRRAETPAGKVKGFKPHAAGFLCYMCSHEAFHRASIEITLRQHGVPLTDKVAYGIWEWGVR